MSSQKLVLGTVQFGLPYGINNVLGVPSLQEVQEILRRARQAGCWTLDTAEAYGSANKRLSQIFAGLSAELRRRYRLIVKFHLNSEESIQKKWEELNLVFNGVLIECFQFHRLADFYSVNLGQLSSLKDSGVIQKVGVSIYTNDEILAACKCEELDVLQIPYNLLDNFSQRASALSDARRAGKEIHGRSVFLQGLFFREPESFSQRLKPLAPWVERIQNLATRTFGPGDSAVARLALSYALGEPLLDRVLVGVDCAKHWSEIEVASHHPLAADLREQIDDWQVLESELLDPSSWAG